MMTNDEIDEMHAHPNKPRIWSSDEVVRELRSKLTSEQIAKVDEDVARYESTVDKDAARYIATKVYTQKVHCWPPKPEAFSMDELVKLVQAYKAAPAGPESELALIAVCRLVEKLK